MKKALFILFCALFILSVAACGSGQAGEPLNDFLSEYGDELHEMVAPLGAVFGEGSSIEIYASASDELVFVFVYDYSLPSEVMGSVIESMELFFVAFADSLREELELPELRLVVRYIDTNDSLLQEQNF